jgi:hypothetical protein
MLWDAVLYIYTLLVSDPLFVFYLHGPRMIGCWGGNSYPQICGRITTHSEIFWHDHHIECQQIISDKFEAFQLTFAVATYFLILTMMLRYMLRLFMMYISPQQLIYAYCEKPQLTFRHI